MYDIMVTSWPAYTEYRNRFSCPFSLFPPTTSAFNWVLVSSYTTKPFTHHSTWQRAMPFHAWSLTEWKFLNDTFNCRTTTINWYVVTAITVPSIIQANLLQHIAHHCRLEFHMCMYLDACMFVSLILALRSCQSHLPSSVQWIDGSSTGWENEF